MSKIIDKLTSMHSSKDPFQLSNGTYRESIDKSIQKKGYSIRYSLVNASHLWNRSYIDEQTFLSYFISIKNFSLISFFIFSSIFLILPLETTTDIPAFNLFQNLKLQRIFRRAMNHSIFFLGFANLGMHFDKLEQIENIFHLFRAITIQQST